MNDINFIETSAKDGTNCIKAMRLMLQSKFPSSGIAFFCASCVVVQGLTQCLAIHNENSGSSGSGFSLSSMLGGGGGDEGEGEEDEEEGGDGCCQIKLRTVVE